MRKITISIKDSSLYFKFRNKKNDDVNLLNTNIISNNELVFSDEYIFTNEKLVSLFLHDLIKENNINKVIINNNALFDLVFTLIKHSNQVTSLELLEEAALPYEICDGVIKLRFIKEISCYQVPTFMIELFDKNDIKVNSTEEVLFASNFMADNELSSYSNIYYKKTITFNDVLSNEDLEDFKAFININKYLRIIEIKKFNLNDLNNIVNLLLELRRKHVVIEIHEDVNNDEDIVALRNLNKTIKDKGIKISLIYSKEYMEKNYSKQVIFTTLEICSLIIFAIVGFVSAFLVYNYYESDRKVSEIQDEIKVAMDTSKDTEKEDKDEEIDEDEKPIINNYDALLDINSDTVGWITVKNTNIDYPVVRTTDNDYYINRNFYKEKDPNGWVFMDYRNSIDEFHDNTIIYAHNRYYSGVMFGTLNNVTKWKWYSKPENWDITFNTLYEEHTWRVFSIYSIDVTSDYLYTKFETKEEYQAFLDMIKNRSDISLKTKATTDDKILTLSTCLNGDRRLVVHAVLITEE